MFEYDGEMIPHDFDQLKSSLKYNYFIKSLKESHEHIIGLNRFISEKIENLISDLQNEIAHIN